VLHLANRRWVLGTHLHLAPDSEGVVLRCQHHGEGRTHGHDGALQRGGEREEEERRNAAGGSEEEEWGERSGRERGGLPRPGRGL